MKTERALTPDQIVAYHRDGFLHIPGLFDAAELAPVQATLRDDPSVGGRLATVHDGSAKTQHDYLGWTRHSDDWLGVTTRLARLVEGAATLIGEPVYHWHSKLVKKPAGKSGQVVWHQDFSGWYQDGCLMPEMLTAIVALTPATRENGCLHMLRGSHKMGRVDRLRDGDAYSTIEPRRLAAMQKRFEDVAVEMAPGDGLFFHANVMHRSDQNRSPNRRWTVLFCFNAARNNPYLEHHHPQYTPLVKVDDDAVRKAGAKLAPEGSAHFRKKSANPPELARRF